MSDRDFAPLTLATVRGLNDKLYEKRKVAALEVEKLVREYVAVNNSSLIKKLLQVLGHDFALSQNPNSRKGGLIGLAATSIALGKESCTYVSELVKPVLTCFFDSDSRVRYYGCEALYNIVKVARGSVLPYFNDIFDGLSKLAADPDQNVRSGAELLDRLMKDIVTESCQFDLVAFIPLLRERIYTKNPFARTFIVSWMSTLEAVPDIDMIIFLPEILDGLFFKWMSTLEAVPDIDMIIFLPEILDGLFTILGDSNPEIRKMCEATLGEFLQGICKRPKKADVPAMVNILIAHSQSNDPVIQYTALVWIREFVNLAGPEMLPFVSGILTAVLPCLSYNDDTHKSIHESAKGVNSALMKLITTQHETGDKSSSSSSNPVNVDIGSVVEVLCRQLVHESMQTRIAALRWIFHLFIHAPKRIFMYVEELFPLLLKTLSDPSDEVVLLDLEVLAEVSSSPAGREHPPKSHTSVPESVTQVMTKSQALNTYYSHFMVNLLQLFATDRQLLEDRGPFIIRQLCILLNAEDIYRCCAAILLEEEEVQFASCMIQILNTILLTSTELFDLRTHLKHLETADICGLFSSMYKAWCHNAVATVSLCFLTQNYAHASDLLTVFGDLEVTVDFLTEVDKLVQLIESPIFTYLRLQLLDTDKNVCLVKSLYGLLMLLPQSDAFRTLQRRLDCIPNIHFNTTTSTHSSSAQSENRTFVNAIDFKELLDHFIAVQQKHKHAQRQVRVLTIHSHTT